MNGPVAGLARLRRAVWTPERDGRFRDWLPQRLIVPAVVNEPVGDDQLRWREFDRKRMTAATKARICPICNVARPVTGSVQLVIHHEDGGRGYGPLVHPACAFLALRQCPYFQLWDLKESVIVGRVDGQEITFGQLQKLRRRRRV